MASKVEIVSMAHTHTHWQYIDIGTFEPGCSLVAKSVMLNLVLLVLQFEVSTSKDNASITFCFHKEDHTIGNALRHIIMKEYGVASLGWIFSFLWNLSNSAILSS